MNIWYNPDDEDHRNWLESFGILESDIVTDNKDVEYQGDKRVPVIEVSIPECSFTETAPEWYNPVTGEELGEQTITLNCEAHNGLYYFETRDEYTDWVTNTLENLADQVDTPDGETNALTVSLLPDRPAWESKYDE
tara:strand:- start:793 stop:1200 length:408 start_codon:yes stop_codon:yes gene_type:complete